MKVSWMRRWLCGREPNPPVWPDTDESKVIVVSPQDCQDPETVKALQEQISDPYDPNSTNMGKTLIPKGTFTSANHFSSRRRAVLFKPGTYDIDLEVGYYSQVLGLGSSSSDVVFEDVKKGNDIIEERYGIFVPALDRHVCPWGLCLNTFWRSAENFSSNVTGRSKQYTGLDQGLGLQWAVSQAAPLRRVHARQGLTLGDGAAYASGGFVANLKVEGITNQVAQQQFCHRNVQFTEGVQHGAWSLVFSGCTDQDNQSYPATNLPYRGAGKPAITVAQLPLVTMEKPYIVLQSDQKRFSLRVPKRVVAKSSTSQTNKDGPVPSTIGPRLGHEPNDSVRDFSRVRVVRSDENSPTLRIQQALDEGKDVVLAAGIFHLTSTIEIKDSNRVILGIGMATLMAPPNGSPCIRVRPFCSGVRLAGIILEASERSSSVPSYPGVSCLLEWGEEGVTDAGKEQNPGGMFDLFCRVGGDTDGDRTKIYVDAMVRLHSGNLVGDNVWLWRADHAKLQKGEEPNYPNISPDYWQVQENELQVKKYGLEVVGNDITIYGLQVEHANGHQTVWRGERGVVVFYQCELPYGVSQTSFGDPGYLGYWVEEGVSQHTVYAPGIYSNFRNHRVEVQTAMQTPTPNLSLDRVLPKAVNVINPFTVLLDNHFG